MSHEIPEHILEQLRKLIDEKRPAEQIAFMMRLDIDVVKREIVKANNTTPSLAGRAAE
jgi:hypothetical protein